MADAVFSKEEKQGDETKLTKVEVKTVSMGWGQEEIVPPEKDVLPPPKTKDRNHYFVKHSGL